MPTKEDDQNLKAATSQSKLSEGLCGETMYMKDPEWTVGCVLSMMPPDDLANAIVAWKKMRRKAIVVSYNGRMVAVKRILLLDMAKKYLNA
jgi:hypothetical protein